MNVDCNGSLYWKGMCEMISVENLSYRVDFDYEGEHQALSILESLNFSIEDNESVAIIGASGSGKTTLLSLLTGLDQPTEGRVVVAGQCISNQSEDERASFRAEHIGIIFQAFHLLPALSALENVLLPLELSGVVHSMPVAKALLEQVGLSHRLTHKPAQMSGGEQQRVAIARAFASRGQVLFADEPTGNLDHKTGTHIMDLIFKLNKEQGKTLVLVTHDLNLAKRCERCLQLQDGQLTEIDLHSSESATELL